MENLFCIVTVRSPRIVTVTSSPILLDSTLILPTEATWMGQWCRTRAGNTVKVWSPLSQLVPNSQLDPPVNWSLPILPNIFLQQVSTEYFPQNIFHQQFSTEYFTISPPNCFHQKLSTKNSSEKCPKVQDQIFERFTWSG